WFMEKCRLVYRGDEKWPHENNQVRVGIGKTDPDPQTKLDVAGGARFDKVRVEGEVRVRGEMWVDGEAKLSGTIGSSADLQMVSNVKIGTKEQGRKLHILNQNQPADATGDTLILGPTDAAHLRLGYNAEYSWIQAHGDKPLALNPMGNNVGIGIDKPEARLHVAGEARFDGIHITGGAQVDGKVTIGTPDRPAGLSIKSRPTIKDTAWFLGKAIYNGRTNWGIVTVGDPIRVNDRISTVTDVSALAIAIESDLSQGGGGSAEVSYAPSPFRIDDATGKPQLVVTGLGSVGIGRMPNHAAKLDVDGPIFAKGIDASAQDLAENYLSDMDLAPGDVVRLDPDQDQIVLSEQPDDLLVMGVISTEPGVLLNAKHDVEDRKDGRLAYPDRKSTRLNSSHSQIS